MISDKRGIRIVNPSHNCTLIIIFALEPLDTDHLKHTKLTLFLALSLLLPDMLSAQTPFLVNGTRDETVMAMGTDSWGMLYFSTLRGLASYDGRDVTEIVTDENINDFFVENDGTIWFCGQYYLGRRLPGRTLDRFFLSSELIYSLSELTPLPGNRMAFLHHDGLAVFDKDSLRVVRSRREIPAPEANLLYDGASGRLWLSSGNRVLAFDEDLHPQDSVSLPGQAHIHSMVSTGSRLVVATTSGLFLVGNRVARPFGPKENVKFIARSTTDGSMVAALDDGTLISVSGEGAVERLAERIPLPSVSLRGFLMDKNHLWLSPDESGIYYFPLTSLRKDTRLGSIEDFFSHKRINVLHGDSQGGMWALADGIVYRADLPSGQVQRIMPPGADDQDRFSTMTVTTDDRLVLCSPATVYLYDIAFDPKHPDAIRLKENPQSRIDLSVYDIRELPEGVLYFRSFTGSYSMDRGGHLTHEEDNRYPLFSDPETRTVVRSSGPGRLSVAIGGQSVTDARLLPEEESLNLAFVDHLGNTWCVTDKFALYKIQPMEGITEPFDLPQWRSVGEGEVINPIFHSIQEDPDGFLWLGTSYGLVRIDPDDPDGFRLFNTGRKYDYYTASFRDADGMLYFAYSNGLTAFDPRKKEPLASNASIRFGIQLILVNDVPMRFGPDLPNRFKYTDNTFVFICSLVDFDNLQTRYAWKLEGFDTDWQYGTVKYASYPNLPHGKYTFRMKIEGAPDSMVQSYSFEILREPWTGPLAIAVYLLLASALIYLLYRYLKGKRERQEREMTRQVDKMKLDVFTNLSHEFRTPLTLVSVPLRDMLHENDLTEAERSKLGIMERNVEKLQRLTDQLLEYDKIDKDFGKLDLKKKDIVRELTEIAENFQYTAQKNGSPIVVTTKEPIEVAYDDIKLGRVMSNLLNNAIKYSPDGGEISISAALVSAKEATKTYGRPFVSNCLEVIVKDHGKGIPSDKLEKIFDQYARADEAGTEGIHGFGIGLHYTRQLVQAHGGSILAAQNQPKGSVFRFVIPDNLLEQADPDTDDPGIIPDIPADETPDYVTGLSILVVEDNDDLREYLVDMFGKGNNVTGAADGQKGLEAAKAQYFDLVISDVMMPVMDGFELLKALREDPDLCAISVVLLTAMADTGSQIHGLNIGADAYVGKPFDPMYLRALVNSIAQRRAVRQNALVHATSKTLESLPEEVVPENPFDRQFITALYGILDRHLEQEEIDINAILQELGMSRTGFYMKVKALTGQSPIQLINEYRMNRAAELLRSGEHSVKEIAYMVGYQERRSFTSRFKAQFGCTPTEYLENNGKTI